MLTRRAAAWWIMPESGCGARPEASTRCGSAPARNRDNLRVSWKFPLYLSPARNRDNLPAMERDREGSPPREHRRRQSNGCDSTSTGGGAASSTAAASSSTMGATARSEWFSCLLGIEIRSDRLRPAPIHNANSLCWVLVGRADYFGVITPPRARET